MSTPGYLEESMQRDIDRIRGRVLEMADRAENALRSALQALLTNHRQQAYTIILRDQFIDELEKEIDQLCLEFLVRQQPAGAHLRFAYATIKINAELERIGDYGESIARQVLKLSALSAPSPSYERFVEIAHLAIPMLRDAVRAFVNQDAALARSTIFIEEKVNTMRDRINSELLYAEKTGRIGLETLTPLAQIARRYERVSDQAKNICEEVLYMCTGEYSKHAGADGFRILFLDAHNSGSSQLAEAVGNSLGLPKIQFSSAGLDSQPLDPPLVAFLAGKGIVLTGKASQAVESIPNLEQFQVIIALTPEVRASFKPAKTKTILLDWPTVDPDLETHSPEQIQAAYEANFHYLRAQIKDLAEAIIGHSESNRPQESPL